MPRLFDLTGRVFTRWTVLRRAANNRHGRPQWVCRCTCGTTRSVDSGNLKTGDSTSCGCYQREAASKGRLLRPHEALYRLLLRSAAHTVALTYEQFVGFTAQHECHYCGASVTWVTTAYNLDRKDNAEGYTVSNCVVCCPRCNWAKADTFTYDEWVQIGALIRSWQK